MPSTPRSRFHRPPETSDVVWSGPIGTIVRVPESETGGLLSACEMPVTPGHMVPPHTHRATDEWTYILAGEISFRIGDDEFVASAGDWVLKPRGIMHTFWNSGSTEARVLELVTPGRFEQFFRRSSQLAADGDLDDDRLGALAEEYETSVSMDWVPDLVERHRLEVTI